MAATSSMIWSMFAMIFVTGHVSFGRYLPEEGLDEVTRDRLEHSGREAEFPGILGQVVDHIRNAVAGSV